MVAPIDSCEGRVTKLLVSLVNYPAGGVDPKRINECVAPLVITYGLERIRFVVDHSKRCVINPENFNEDWLRSSIASELHAELAYFTEEESHAFDKRLETLLSDSSLTKEKQLNEIALDNFFLAVSEDDFVYQIVKGAWVRQFKERILGFVPDNLSELEIGLGIRIRYSLQNPDPRRPIDDAPSAFLQDHVIITKDSFGSLLGFASPEHFRWASLHTGFPCDDIGFDLSGHGGNMLGSKGLMFVGKGTVQHFCNEGLDVIDLLRTKLAGVNHIIEVGLCTTAPNLESYPKSPELVWQPCYHIDLFMAVLNHNVLDKKITLLMAEPWESHYRNMSPDALAVVTKLKKLLFDTEISLIKQLEQIHYSVIVRKCPMGLRIEKTDLGYQITDYHPLINGIFETHLFGRSLTTAFPRVHHSIKGDCDISLFRTDFQHALSDCGYSVSEINISAFKLAGLHCLTLALGRI